MSQITEETFEQAFNQFLSAPAIDLKDAAFIDPYGMVGILEIGELSSFSKIPQVVSKQFPNQFQNNSPVSFKTIPHFF